MSIVLFVRRKNRLLLNEKEVIEALTARYNATVQMVGMETHSTEQQMQILGRADMAIGVHGSIFVMGMFMKPGAVLVELFPFAVPAAHYTPYKTLANLRGMDLVYRAWEVSDTLIRGLHHPPPLRGFLSKCTHRLSFR